MNPLLKTWCWAICFLALPASNALAGSCVGHIDCDDGDSCTYDLCVDGTCTNTPALFGDVVGGEGACGPDGIKDIYDGLYVLYGIAGIEKPCRQVNVDLAGPFGCGPDGTVDVYDLIWWFDAFTGAERCCEFCHGLDGAFCNGAETCDDARGLRIDNVPCPGQLCDEANDSCVAPEAIVSCQLSQDIAFPGDWVTLDLFLQNVNDLHAYQIGIDTTRMGGTGEISCTSERVRDCMFVVTWREDYAFHDILTAWETSTASGLAIVSVSQVSSVDVGSTPVYLGTYQFQVSYDAILGSTFELSIRPDGVLWSSGVLWGTWRVPIGYVSDSPCVLRIPPDCDGNGIADICDFDCDVAGGDCDVPGCGQAVDCNHNEVLDACDIAEGTSGDCNGNAIPDECETDCDDNGVADVCEMLDCDGHPDCGDCNENGVLDYCDIVYGDSRDLNNDGVPDECVEPTDATRLFMVRQGLDPLSFPAGRNSVNLQNGESMTFDIWVQNTGVPLRAYQVELGDATGGEEGFVRFDRSPAITNPFLDETRPDWVHFGQDAVTALESGQTGRIVSAMSSGGVLVTEPGYCGEITYTAGADACGEFAIDFLDPGAIPGVSRTALADASSNALEFVADGIDVSVGSAVFGDADGSGRVDLFDILCVLDGFSGVFDRCTLSSVDLVPCEGDEVVGLADILAVLDAFASLPAPCPTAPCGQNGAAGESRRPDLRGAKAARPDDRAAVVMLVPRRGVISAGESVAVDVFAARLHDLRGYQIAVDAVGRDGGRLLLADAAIDPDRTDQVFHGRAAYSSIDLAGRRLTQALPDGGVDAGRPRYLGTFTFRVPRGTRGTFDLTLRARDTALSDSAGRRITTRLRNRLSIEVR